jgi:hypothetical protein
MRKQAQEFPLEFSEGYKREARKLQQLESKGIDCRNCLLHPCTASRQALLPLCFGYKPLASK